MITHLAIILTIYFGIGVWGLYNVHTHVHTHSHMYTNTHWCSPAYPRAHTHNDTWLLTAISYYKDLFTWHIRWGNPPCTLHSCPKNGAHLMRENTQMMHFDWTVWTYHVTSLYICMCVTGFRKISLNAAPNVFNFFLSVGCTGPGGGVLTNLKPIALPSHCKNYYR